MIITIGPFTKWGVEFMNCNLASARGNHHIIVAIDYFTKWEEAMPLSNPIVRQSWISFSIKLLLGLVSQDSLS